VSRYGNSIRLVRDVPRDGFLNMAIDVVLSAAAASGATTLRLYAFDPPAITIGRFQESASLVDRAACDEMGIDIVRRPTGGQAILHTNDFTYSFTCPVQGAPGGAAVFYFELVGQKIIESLRILGLEARMASHDTRNPEPGWCFAREFGVDREWNSRKICGSAQRVSAGAVLQHGSLFLEETREVMERISVAPVPAGEELVTLKEACARAVCWSEVADAFETGFAAESGVIIEQGVISDEEVERATRLAEGFRSGRGGS
jgi:lipoate-protein ligase A